MKLYWKDADGNLRHGSDGDFDPDLVKFENVEGRQQAQYVGPDGTTWLVASFSDDRDALVRNLQRSYAAWLSTLPGLRYVADTANDAYRKACDLPEYQSQITGFRPPHGDAPPVNPWLGGVTPDDCPGRIE